MPITKGIVGVSSRNYTTLRATRYAW